jgi:hypothetical protein
MGFVAGESKSAGKPVATAGSRHLTSPKEESKYMVTDEPQTIRDMKALWMKNN